MTTTALAVTSDAHMLPPSDRHTPVAHRFTPPEKQSLDDALAETQSLLDQHGYLVVVFPGTLPRPFLHRLHTVRGLLETDRIALLPTVLPPLATGVLVRQLRQLSLCEFSPGVLGSAARLLAHYIYAGAVLGSVAKLDRVPVSLTSHAKSWLPGAQFAVLATPVPQLVRVGGGSSKETLRGPQFTTRLTVAPGSVGADWVTGTLAAAWQAGEVQREELPSDSAAWWGTGKLTEFAAAIPDLSTLYQLVTSVRRDACHWCGLELMGDRCAFCSAPVPQTPAPGPVARHHAGHGHRPDAPGALAAPAGRNAAERALTAPREPYPAVHGAPHPTGDQGAGPGSPAGPGQAPGTGHPDDRTQQPSEPEQSQQGPDRQPQPRQPQAQQPPQQPPQPGTAAALRPAVHQGIPRP